MRDVFFGPRGDRVPQFIGPRRTTLIPLPQLPLRRLSRDARRVADRELTVIRYGWCFNFDNHHLWGVVIWAIGWSMIALAAFVHLPIWVTATVGLVMIIGHNAFDRLTPESFGSFGWLWRVLYARGNIDLAEGYVLHIDYALIPWIGVMAAGYAFGGILKQDRAKGTA